MRYNIIVLILLSVIFLEPAQAANKVLRIYIDADRTHNKESGLSIERGIRTAFSEVDNQIQGYKIEVVPMDHRGNSHRSKQHLDKYLKDENALAVFGGLHSPPLMKHRGFINDNAILTLVPWAAAGPITRAKTNENWIYRLSVDDSKAGFVIADYAVMKEQCKAPHLLLEDTPWGKSNFKTMTSAIKAQGLKLNGTTWFGWNLKDQGARIHLRDIAAKKADCVLLVANTPEGITFAKAMLDLPKDSRMKIISHWGITGGKFHEAVPAAMRSKLSLHFIQSCFSFVSGPHSDLSKIVLKRAADIFPQEITDARSIKAPVGFIHAYDLSKLLITALQSTDLGNDIVENRKVVKIALENIKGDVSGLVKKYNMPFSSYNPSAKDAHEALGKEDYCMGQYGPDDEILVLLKQ